jgi:hypothetical protein
MAKSKIKPKKKSAVKVVKQVPDFFTKLVTVVLSGLVAAVVLLALLNMSTSLHVRSVEINGASSAAEIQNQKLTVHFNRPLQKETATAATYISPGINHVVSWQGNDMVITFTDNLQSNTEYSFIITPEAKDVYGSNLTTGFTYNFKTKPAKLFYREVDSTGTEVRIMSADPELIHLEEVYKADSITRFAVSKNYLAVVEAVPNEPTNKLVLRDLRSGEDRSIDFDNARINKLAFSPTRNELAVIVQNYIKVQNTLIPDAGSKIRIYDLNSLSYREVNPQNVANEVVDIVYAPNGQNMLFKVSDSNFYIADLNRPGEVVILGKHLFGSGFNRQSDRLLFIDFDPLNTFFSLPYLNLLDSNKNAVQLTGNDSYVVDPQFFNNEQRIIYSEKHSDVEGTRGLYKLMITDFTGKSLHLYTDVTRSLELPKLSADDRYIVVERYEVIDILDYNNQRDFQFQTKPAHAELIVIDMITGLIADKGVKGVDAIWQP